MKKRWKHNVSTAMLLSLALFVAACGQKPAPAPSASAGSNTPKPEWQVELDKIYEAAKNESLTIATHPGEDYELLMKDFQKAYPGIKVEHTGIRPSDFTPKVTTEQKNGVYGWDVWTTSSSNMNNVVLPAGGFQDLTPFLIRPDVKDPNSYRGNKLHWSSPKGNFILLHVMGLEDNIFVNTDVLKSLGIDKFTIDSIVDPKLKGKIVQRPADREHGGSLSLTGLAHAKGKEFVTKYLTEQKPTLIDNATLATERVMKGQDAVVIGAANEVVQECWKNGGCKNIVQPKVAPYVLPRGVGVLKNAPHPNAAKIFVNWFLSKEGQESWTKARKVTFTDLGHSNRKDVIPAHPDNMIDYDNMGKYTLQGTDSGQELMNWVTQTFKDLQKK